MLAVLFSFMGIAQSGEPAQFDREAMEAYARQPDFQYMQVVMEPPSLIDRLWWWLLDLWREFWDNPVNSRLTHILFIIIMAAVAVYFIRRMVFQRVLVGGGDQMAGMMGTPLAQERVDYAKLVQESLEKRDFKLAVRFLYLQSLILLSSKEAIRLADWKTPYDYELELRGAAVEPYARLSALFEYAWYGDLEVKRADFDKGRNFFERLEEALE